MDDTCTILVTIRVLVHCRDGALVPGRGTWHPKPTATRAATHYPLTPAKGAVQAARISAQARSMSLVFIGPPEPWPEAGFVDFSDDDHRTPVASLLHFRCEGITNLVPAALVFAV